MQGYADACTINTTFTCHQKKNTILQNHKSLIHSQVIKRHMRILFQNNEHVLRGTLFTRLSLEHNVMEVLAV